MNLHFASLLLYIASCWNLVGNSEIIITICGDCKIFNIETNELCIGPPNFPKTLLIGHVWLQTITVINRNSCTQAPFKLFQDDCINSAGFCIRKI
ncbi:hypothetical protein EUGRSUZ_J00705 [Eucalyptus grandis]|uniref:Uncharacterized protein n=2 Tax=Eucalyptus grandis TaxID=71139 RepID=A0ACC3J3U7_EUCGR|nr:hypothetical protein EUGRSUZ_J00705 [Eucalyptus grandis]